jgi:hypothetical protein
VSWLVANLRCRHHKHGPLAFPGKVAEAVAAQATSWQPASHNTVRVGKTVEAFVPKLCRDPLSLRELFLAMLNRGDRRLRHLPLEDLPPPFGVGCRDPSVATKALAGRNAAIQWSSRQVMHQLGARPAASPPPSPRALLFSVHHATAPNHTILGTQRGHSDRLCRATSSVLIGGVVILGRLAIVVRPSSLLRAPPPNSG